MRDPRGLLALIVTFAYLLVPRGSPAQTIGRESTHGRKTIRAVATENGVTVDGSLDEPVWRQAPVASGFLQRDPKEGTPATEMTEFRVLFTTTTLYIGITCHDSSPQEILASERRRDGNLGNDDTVSIVLDTFHDHRNSYRFSTNPLGAQQDALITDEGNNTNENWDERWDVAARITEIGWTAEFAIPFKSLRVPEENGSVWGLDIGRVIRRKNESDFWDNYRRGFDLEKVSQAGHLQGIEDIETGLRLRVKPFVLGGISHTTNRAQSSLCLDSGLGSRTCNASDAGIEVLKYRITPSLTADFTLNTDFAQTEVDDQEINLDRFPLFFPEKREFFQEGAGVFEFGAASGESFNRSITKLFHSRQIGLSPNRQIVPIVGGGRITGRLRGMTLGLLNVQTEQYLPENIPASNYSVLRMKRNVLARSTVGAFFLNREMGGTANNNRVYGADANFVFFRYLAVGGWMAKSRAPGITDDNWATAGEVKWESDSLNLQTSWLVVDPDFRDDLGFVPRKDRRESSSQLHLRPRPRNNRYIRQFVFRSRLDYTMNSQNKLETRIIHNGFEVRFQNGDVFTWGPHTRFDTFYRPFTNRQGVWIIPPGSYSWWNNELRYSLNPSRKISGQIINWVQHFGYYGAGTFHDININPRLRLTDRLSAQISYGINKVTFPSRVCVDKTKSSCGFTDHLMNARINFNLNNRWLTSTTLQYNNADHFWGLNFRLNYIFRPGDDFFLIYNEGRRFQDAAGVPYGPNDRTLQAKLTYSFDF